MAGSRKKATKKGFAVKRLVFDAVLIALMFVLSSASIRIGNTFKITFDSVAVLLAAMMFGPVDALMVGLLGEFMAQMLSYGFTPTTLLWMMGPGLRGLVLGLGVVVFKHGMSINAITKEKKFWFYGITVIVASVVTSLCNTFALYVDSTLFGYYSYYLVLGALFTRILTGIASSVLVAIVVLPVLIALKRARVTKLRCDAPSTGTGLNKQAYLAVGVLLVVVGLALAVLGILIAAGNASALSLAALFVSGAAKGTLPIIIGLVLTVLGVVLVALGIAGEKKQTAAA